MNIETARLNMIEQQIRPWHISDLEVLKLLKIVKREHFVPCAYRNIAFADLDVPLPSGQCMLSPKIEARMLQALAVKKHESVLEVGAGSGYMAALLGAIAYQVLTVDIVNELAQFAQQNLSSYGVSNVTVAVGDGARGWPETAPAACYDVIMISGGLPVLPQRLLAQLKVNGRLGAFIGQAPVMQAQIVKRISETEYQSISLFETYVPPLINAQQTVHSFTEL